MLAKSEGGKFFVELYLNYDCDDSSSSEDNLWEQFMNSIATALSTKVPESGEPNVFTFNPIGRTPAVTTASLTNYTKDQIRQLHQPFGDAELLKTMILNLLVYGVLEPINAWRNERLIQLASPVKSTVSNDIDDPETFEISKNRKALLAEGIKLFNQRPKTVTINL